MSIVRSEMIILQHIYRHCSDAQCRHVQMMVPCSEQFKSFLVHTGSGRRFAKHKDQMYFGKSTRKKLISRLT